MKSVLLADREKLRTRLQDWLAAHAPSLGKPIITSIDVADYAGLASDTWLLTTCVATEPGPGLVVRFSKSPALYLDSDLGLHAQMYQNVKLTGQIPAPTVIGLESDPGYLGQPFLVLERLPGRAPPDRPNFNYAGWLTELTPDQRHVIWQEAVTVMARLHGLHIGLFPLLLQRFPGPDNLRATLDYWMQFARWCGAEDDRLLQCATDWLLKYLPEPNGAEATLSWGDARMQNFLFSDTRCTGLLDWDMVSGAGAIADLAWWALADHKYTASCGKARLEGIPSPAATVAFWEALTGRKADHMEWHLVFAAYRQALISTRISQMPAHGKFTERKPGDLPIGKQWIACLLDLPLDGDMTLPFVGLDR